MPARLDNGRKHGLCEDMPFLPLPEGFIHTPSGTVLSSVREAMWASGFALCGLDGSPSPEGLSPLFLDQVVNLPEPVPRGAITTRNEHFMSTAALSERRGHTARAQTGAPGDE